MFKRNAYLFETVWQELYLLDQITPPSTYVSTNIQTLIQILINPTIEIHYDADAGVTTQCRPTALVQENDLENFRMWVSLKNAMLSTLHSSAQLRLWGKSLYDCKIKHWSKSEVYFHGTLVF